MNLNYSILFTSYYDEYSKAKSSVDWCEMNYQFTPYVAELINTITSLCFIIMGILGYFYHVPLWKRIPRIHQYSHLHVDNTFSWIGIMIIGIGSAAFHMTLLRIAQALDELPMIWLMLIMLYHSFLIRYRYFLENINLLRLFLLILFITLTSIYSLFPSFYGIFLFIFISLLCLTLYFTYSALKNVSWYNNSRELMNSDYKNYNNNNKTKPAINLLLFPSSLSSSSSSSSSNSSLVIAPAVQLISKSLLYFIIAILFWIIDTVGCGYFWPNWFYGHGIWHILVSISVYLFILTQQILLMQIMQAPQLELHYYYKFIPILKVQKRKSDMI